jgi:hypothetical protein
MVIGTTLWRLKLGPMKRIGINVITILRIYYEEVFESNPYWLFGPLVI